MKKTLAVAAVLAAFAGSAAADVTVYGKIDLGLKYTHQDKAGVTTSTTEMGSGLSSGSRVGFKGSEKIGDLTVGFNYEASIAADQNKAATTAETTSRVSQVYVKGAFGEVGAGYYGALDGATGPYDSVSGLTANGTGWSGVTDHSFVLATPTLRLANAVTYKAPTFAGVTALAQVGTFEEGAYSHANKRYYGAAVSYKAGAFGAGAVVSTHEQARGVAQDDAWNYTAGVNYDFGVAKVFLAANYNESGVKGHEQYGVHLSASAPVVGGTLYVATGYGEVTNLVEAVEVDTKKYTIGAAYKYPLSKQTYLYTAAGYDQEKTGDDKTKTVRAMAGLCHNF